MNRDQLIEMIDAIDPENEVEVKDLCVHFESRAKSQSRLVSLACDLEQSIAYILILLLPDGLFFKGVRRSVRFSFRAILFGILLSVVLLIELAVLVAIATQFSNETYAMAAVFFVMFAEFALIGSWFERIKKRHSRSPSGLHSYCINCRYNLSGLDSSLIGSMNLGPHHCPECGCAYPAIS